MSALYFHPEDKDVLLSIDSIKTKHPNVSFPTADDGRVDVAVFGYQAAPPAPPYDPNTEHPPLWVEGDWVIQQLPETEIAERAKAIRVAAWDAIRQQQSEKLQATDFYELPSAADRYTDDSILEMRIWRDEVRVIDHTFNYPDGDPLSVKWPQMPAMVKKK